MCIDYHNILGLQKYQLTHSFNNSNEEMTKKRRNTNVRVPETTHECGLCRQKDSVTKVGVLNHGIIYLTK